MIDSNFLRFNQGQRKIRQLLKISFPKGLKIRPAAAITSGKVAVMELYPAVFKKHSTPELRMFVDHEGSRTGSISQS